MQERSPSIEDEAQDHCAKLLVPHLLVDQPRHADFGDWLELHGRKLYREVRDDLRADLRTQDARWQSLNARISALGKHICAQLEDGQTQVGAELRNLADALYALRNELKAQRAPHRDPFAVLAGLLRDLRPSGVRAGHAIWPPKSIDSYLRTTWRLTDPQIRSYKAVWRDAKLIAVERDAFARKFTVEPGVVAYMFAVPNRVFDLFRIEAGLDALPPLDGNADKAIGADSSTEN